MCSSDLYLSNLNTHNADRLYHNALTSLIKIASCPSISGYAVPSFTRETYLAELQWFTQWYINQYIGQTLLPAEATVLQEMFALIVDQALSQPQVLVHKDYQKYAIKSSPNIDEIYKIDKWARNKTIEILNGLVYCNTAKKYIPKNITISSEKIQRIGFNTKSDFVPP